MLASVLALVLEIMQYGIYSLALLSDRVDNVFGHALVEVDKVVEVANWCKSVLLEALDNALAHLLEVVVAVSLALFYLVEGIEQHSAAETNLHLSCRFAVVGKDRKTRVVLQWKIGNVRLAEVVAQLCLDLLGRHLLLERLWLHLVEAVLPHAAYKVAIRCSLGLAYAPRQRLLFAGFKLDKRRNLRSEGELAYVASRCLQIGIAKGELGLARLVVEAKVAYSGVAGENNLAMR